VGGDERRFGFCPCTHQWCTFPTWTPPPTPSPSAVGSDDHKVMVVEAANIMNCWSLEGCGGPVKSLSMHRLGSGGGLLVVASSADGSVRVWHVTLDDTAVNVDPVASLDCLPIIKSAPLSTAARYEAAFRPNDGAGASGVVELAVLVDNDVEVRVCARACV
jgi:hypothetical protein